DRVVARHHEVDENDAAQGDQLLGDQINVQGNTYESRPAAGRRSRDTQDNSKRTIRFRRNPASLR
ncbi:hypothetical protein, partial [Zavarzinia sp.]|uniref:hypothetical protein n=1 Tax=Zavarzinia sp. TaxID=2027920 RepID=UPI003567A31B